MQSSRNPTPPETRPKQIAMPDETEDSKTTERPRELEPLDVYTVITAMVEQMAAISWQKLGLQPDIMNGRIHADLTQAKVAIDLTAHLASFIEPKLDEEDKKRLHGLVRDLKINWVEKNKEVIV